MFKPNNQKIRAAARQSLDCRHQAPGACHITGEGKQPGEEGLQRAKARREALARVHVDDAVPVAVRDVPLDRAIEVSHMAWKSSSPNRRQALYRYSRYESMPPPTWLRESSHSPVSTLILLPRGR